MLLSYGIGKQEVRVISRRARELGVPQELRLDLLRIAKADGFTNTAISILERIAVVRERLLKGGEKHFEKDFAARCNMMIGDYMVAAEEGGEVAASAAS